MPFEWSVTELAERLTMSGTEVESIEKIGGISDQVVIAEVKTVRKHPNADKLTVCEVFDGSTTSQVVCGAPNVAEGQKVLFAKIGAQLPNGITIKKSKLRGIDSFGMICSYAELNLGEDKSGIAVLSPQSIVGMKAEEFFGRSDFILELEITPNRPDCLSHRGIARELQALGGGQLRSPETRLIESGPRTDDEISIEIANPDDCPRYAARLIRNVEVKPSPTWLVERLRGLGIRAINNIVDVTNFVMMEYGQPLHAFDFGLFSHKKIIVRGAKDGEKFTTLDRVDRKLPAGAILITDGIKPVALGGIMGGLNSEVSNITSGVLLEAAYFNPVTIRKTAKSVGLSTESSQRFERGADYEGLIVALDRAAQLINELAGGTIDIGSADCYPLKFQDKTITLRASQVNNLLGTTLSLDGMLRILNSLDIETTTTSQDSLKCIVPSFRPDLNRPVDLIEEIARIYGLGNIASSETLAGSLNVMIPESFVMMNRVRDFLTNYGFDEVVNWVLCDPLKYRRLNYNFDPVEIINPLSIDTAILRPHLWGSLLGNVAYNLNRNLDNIRIFEVDRIFKSLGQGKLPSESMMLGLAWTGSAAKPNWANPRREVDLYDLKGLAEDFIADLNAPDFVFCGSDNPFLDTELRLGLSIAGKNLGEFGLISREAASIFEVKAPVWIMAVNLDILIGNRIERKTFKEPPKFPHSDRDLAIVLDNYIQIGDLLLYLKELHQKYLENIQLFDVYSGKQIPEGKKSVALSFRFRHPVRTLTDAEIDSAMNSILSSLKAKYTLDLRE